LLAREEWRREGDPEREAVGFLVPKISGVEVFTLKQVSSMTAMFA
jgi:hypothetical protein